MSSIAPLRTDDQALIKSASLLGSLRSIVEELVMNSLEADARNVDVYVDSSKNLLMVKDDGKLHSNSLSSSHV
jgi:DNA mismatch repair ATPase MutL